MAETLPESLVENGFEAPTSAADEHFAALAYPGSDISEQYPQHQSVYTAVKEDDRRRQARPGSWVWSTKAVYPPAQPARQRIHHLWRIPHRP
jgi:hypothetical protein